MQLRRGYKQTDAGIIPTEWDAVPLSKLIIEFRGGAPLKPSDFTSTGIKVLPKGGVGRTGWLEIEDHELQFCSQNYATSHRSNQVDQNFTIVVLRDLVPSGPSIGLIVQIKEDETYVLAQGVYGFRVNQSVEPRYLVHLSNTYWYRQLMKSIMVGSTQVHVTNAAFKSLIIPLPSPREQLAIAGALGDVDALIEELDRLIAKKRYLKQAAMQQLLTGRTRLLGFSGEWDDLLVNDVIVNSFCGPSPTCEERNIADEFEWGVLKTTAATVDGGWNWRAHKVLPRAFWHQHHIALRKGDLIVTKAGPRHRVGVAVWIDFVPPRVIPSGKMIALRPDPKRAVPLLLAAAISAPAAQTFLD